MDNIQELIFKHNKVLRFSEDKLPVSINVVQGVSWFRMCFLTSETTSAGPPLESSPQSEAGHVCTAGTAVGPGGRDPGQTARPGGAEEGQGREPLL